MTVKELINELIELSRELPDKYDSEVCVELLSDQLHSGRYTPECYFDEDENTIVIGV